MTHSCREYQVSDKDVDHKAARQSETARATIHQRKSRIGRRWIDGNGIEQHWSACSEIHHMAWFLATSSRVNNR